MLDRDVMLDEKSKRFYRRALESYESGPGALGFELGTSQQVRFELIRDAVRTLQDPRVWYSMLDVGCGVGDLPKYLLAHADAPTSYLGLDLMPEMISRAKMLAPDNKSNWCYEVADIRKPWAQDYVRDRFRGGD